MTSLLVVIGLLLMVSSCSEPNPFAPHSGNVHPEAFYNPQYKTTKFFHGKKLDKEEKDSCRVCHGSDLQGSGDVAGCWDCHFGPDGNKVPDGIIWVHAIGLHDGLFNYGLVCNNCHDYERIYDTGPPKCHDCHGVGINHVLGQEWLDKKSALFHGITSLADCSDCHNLAQKCYECHFGATGSRSPGPWIHGSGDDHEDYSQYGAVCNKCHDLNRSYSNPPPSCHDCHV